MRIGRARPDGGLLRATVRHRRDGGSAPTPKEVRSQDRIDGRRSEPWPSRTPCATQLDIPVVAAPLFLVSEPDQANGAIEVPEATPAGVPAGQQNARRFWAFLSEDIGSETWAPAHPGQL